MMKNRYGKIRTRAAALFLAAAVMPQGTSAGYVSASPLYTESSTAS